MLRFAAALLAFHSLIAASQVGETVGKGTAKTVKVTKEAAKDTAEGTKKVAQKTGQLAGTAAEKTVDTSKAIGKKTAVVTRDVASGTADATKTGVKKVTQVFEPKKNPSSTAGKVNLNTATRAQLIALPGIGDANADKIIKARPIASVEELSTRKIIQTQYYEKVKGLVSVK